MITIKEISPPLKISGISSFLITFDFKQEIVDKIKELPFAIYHKKIYTWEIPINEISTCLDSLTYFDDITLTLLPECIDNNKEEVTESEIQEFKFTPFKHQIEAINFTLNKKKILLLDSMGLGKTNSIIWTAECLHKRGIIDHCLIICGVDSLRQNWKNEINKFSNESALVLGEKITRTGKTTYVTLDKRAEILKNPINEFFIITNAASLRSDKVIEALIKSPNKIGMIAVDEIHKFSSKSAIQSSNLLKLKAEYKIGATGTPIVNSPISIYMPLSWTENDSATLTNYKSFYCNFGGFNNSQIIGYKNLDILINEISNCSLRRTLDQVRSDMPAKTVTTEIVEMSDEQQKFYNAIKEGVKEEADKINLNTSNLLALTIRLRQATVFPGLLTSEPIMSAKIDRCVEMVEELVEAHEKVVVFSTFKDPIYRLAELLKEYKPLVNTGDQTEAEVQRNVDNFQNNPNLLVFLGTQAKCGTGITLNAASYLIMLDESWVAAQNDQSFDRIWRVNNTRPAFVTILMCKDTIDERVHEVAQMKQDLSDYMIDGKDNPTMNDTLKAIIKEL